MQFAKDVFKSMPRYLFGLFALGALFWGAMFLEKIGVIHISEKGSGMEKLLTNATSDQCLVAFLVMVLFSILFYLLDSMVNKKAPEAETPEA